MKNPFSEITPRTFNLKSVPGLSDDARKAVNAAFDAMSAWRMDAAKSIEKYDQQVIEKIAAAAKALGWPEQIVDAARMQMHNITKTQIETMDHIMDVWEEQIKSPNPMTGSLSTTLSKLQSPPGLGSSSGWPTANALQMAAMNPLQFWAQCAQQWQKAWTDAMGVSAKTRQVS